MDTKIIGLMAAWGAEQWITPAIRQALEICDEVFLCVAAHSEAMKKYEDSTLEIASAFKNVNIIQAPAVSTHSQAKAAILNQMLSKAEYFSVGNWIWLLDVDEFYLPKSIRKIKEITKLNSDRIRIEAKAFLIDTKHYLRTAHTRLFRITGIGDKFYPTQNWGGAKETVVVPVEYGMLHYCLLTNPAQRQDQWRTEYPGKEQKTKTTWIDEIYLKYDLQNEEIWINKNKKLFGLKSPWYNRSFAPNKHGKLFKYDGPHPVVVEEAGLTKIEDFRKCYNQFI